MGHQVKVVAQQSGWDPDTFLGKVFASLEMRFASEHDVLGIRACGEGIGEDLYMAIEQPEAWGRRFARAMFSWYGDTLVFCCILCFWDQRVVTWEVTSL